MSRRQSFKGSGLSGEGSSLERRPCLIEKADRVNWSRILHKVHAGRRQSSRGISSQQRSSPLVGIPYLHMQPPSCAVLRRGPIAQCRPRRCQPICLINAQQTPHLRGTACSGTTAHQHPRPFLSRNACCACSPPHLPSSLLGFLG